MRSWAYLLCLSLWLVTTAQAATFGPPGTPLESCSGGDEDPISQSGKWSNAILSTHASTVICAGGLIDKGAVAGIGSAWWNVTTFGPDTEAAYVFTDSEGGNNSVDIMVRITSPGGASPNGYKCRFWGTDANQQILLVRTTGGSDATIATDNATTIADGDSVGCSAIGSTITAWHKPVAGSWTAKLSTTDANHGSAGYVGLIFSSTTTYGIDNFWAATVGAAGGRRFVAPIIFP